MSCRWVLCALTISLVALSSGGCYCPWWERCPPGGPGSVTAAGVIVPRQQYFQAPTGTPCPGCPPSQVATVPGPVLTPPALDAARPNAPIIRPPSVSERPATPSWQPAQPPPSQPLPSTPDSNRTRLNIPEPMERPAPPPELPPTPPGNDAQGQRKDDLTVEIPQFEVVYDKVAAGLQPFPDGFRLLAAQGYRSVLHIRQETEDATAVKASVEPTGLAYRDLVVSAKTLTRETVDRFSRLVSDPSGHPLFVFDRKGHLAGALWYLHFRLNDGLPDAEARRRAARLGLVEETAGDQADLWLAIHAILRGA